MEESIPFKSIFESFKVTRRKKLMEERKLENRLEKKGKIVEIFRKEL